MPELPEVETTVRGLARYLEGATIARVSVNRPDLRRPFPEGLVVVQDDINDGAQNFKYIDWRDIRIALGL